MGRVVFSSTSNLGTIGYCNRSAVWSIGDCYRDTVGLRITAGETTLTSQSINSNRILTALNCQSRIVTMASISERVLTRTPFHHKGTKTQMKYFEPLPPEVESGKRCGGCKLQDSSSVSRIDRIRLWEMFDSLAQKAQLWGKVSIRIANRLRWYSNWVRAQARHTSCWRRTHWSKSSRAYASRISSTDS